jgi:ribosomal protein S16
LLKGAQPTETVRSLFRKHGVMDRFTKAKNGEAAVQKEEDGAVEEE